MSMKSDSCCEGVRKGGRVRREEKGEMSGHSLHVSD
jgi:hypothetical protein